MRLADRTEVAGLLTYLAGHGLVKAVLFMVAGILLATCGGIDEIGLRGLGRPICRRASSWRQVACCFSLMGVCDDHDRTGPGRALRQMKRAAGRTGALQPLPPFTGPGLPEGTLALGLDPARDGLVRCPLETGAPMPLFVLLHGAGGTAEQGLALGAARPEAAGAVLLAPQSRAATWDMIAGGWGPDVRFIGRAMGHVAARVRIDPSRIAVGGFSDGASYALSLGLANGGLFGAILAFSPGFAAPPSIEGRPRIYVSHGTQDQVLPIERCSRRLVPQLQGAGYDVRYHEFPGGHVVPAEIAGEAFAWALPDGGSQITATQG